MSLPILTTADDVRGIVSYLKNKPTGATTAEARAAVKKLIDPRKVAGYQLWKIVTKDGDRLKLDRLGWELARQTRPEAAIFSEIAGSVPAYRSVLEWVFHQSFNSVSNVDVAAHWHEHHSGAGSEKEATIKDQAVCFFHLAEAAELGSLVLGRKGQSTRLEVNRPTLQKFVEQGPAAPPWVEPARIDTEASATGGDQPTEKNVSGDPRNASTAVVPMADAPPDKSAADLRVFIAHGRNMDIVEQVQTMLENVDIAGEIAEDEETAAIPVPEKVFTAMRRCNAAIIVVSVDEAHKDHDGNYTPNENVLIEIGASFVLYDKKVVLVWDKRLAVPSNLQGLYRCEYEGNELSWTSGMKLMKALKGFKSS